MADGQQTPASNSKNVMFADFAVVKYSALMEQFQAEGFGVDSATDEKMFLEKISGQAFDLCVLNLLLGGVGPFELIRSVRSVSRNPEIKVIVISKQVQKLNIQNALKAGANDFVADPVQDENLRNRILYHLTPKHVIDNLGKDSAELDQAAWPYLTVLLEATESLARTESTDINTAFYEILGQVAGLLGSNRTSIMIVDEESNSGVVLASSDDASFSDFPVVLDKYPEVLDVVHSGSFVLVDDVSKNQLTQRINETVRSISIGSMMVFPVRYAGEVVGVMTVRRAKASDLPSMAHLRVVQAVANTLGAHANIKAALRRIYRDYVPPKTA